MLKPYELALLGNDDKKAETTTKTTKAPTVNRFAAWGHLGDVAQQQGWYPTRWNDDVTEYKSAYGLLNSLPNGGYISLVGGNKNGVFDIHMKDKNGNITGTLLKGATPEQVQRYFTDTNMHKDNYGNPIGSVINQRANQIQAGANRDVYNTMALRK